MTQRPATQTQAASPQWLGIGALTACTAVLSTMLACATPFAALAAIAVLFLPSRRVLPAAAAVWLTNQAVGYLLLDYPHSASSHAWGLMIGLGLVLATLAAQSAWHRLTSQPWPVSWGATYLAALSAFQTMMAAGYALLGGAMTLDGVLTVFRIDVLAFVGFLLALSLLGKAADGLHLHWPMRRPVSGPCDGTPTRPIKDMAMETRY